MIATMPVKEPPTRRAVRVRLDMPSAGRACAGTCTTGTS